MRTTTAGTETKFVSNPRARNCASIQTWSFWVSSNLHNTASRQADALRTDLDPNLTHTPLCFLPTHVCAPHLCRYLLDSRETCSTTAKNSDHRTLLLTHMPHKHRSFLYSHICVSTDRTHNKIIRTQRTHQITSAYIVMKMR